MSEKIPLVLLPGLLCDRELWRDQITALSDISEIHVADLTRNASLAGMAQHVLECAPPRFALAGLSMGGVCALEVMRQAPERVIRLALLDTSARKDTPEQTARRHSLMSLATKGNFIGVSPRLLPLFLHLDRLDDIALVERVTSMARRVGKEAFLRQQEALIHRPDVREDLAAISCPTMILCGRQDLLAPLALHEEMATLIKNSTLMIIEECGHLSTMEKPEAVNAALSAWLS